MPSIKNTCNREWLIGFLKQYYIQAYNNKKFIIFSSRRFEQIVCSTCAKNILFCTNGSCRKKYRSIKYKTNVLLQRTTVSSGIELIFYFDFLILQKIAFKNRQNEICSKRLVFDDNQTCSVGLVGYHRDWNHALLRIYNVINTWCYLILWSYNDIRQSNHCVTNLVNLVFGKHV